MTPLVATLCLAVLAFSVLIVVLIYRKRRQGHPGISLDAVARAMAEASDEGERAYRAQVETTQRYANEQGEVSVRGLALARFLPPLFIAFAFEYLRRAHLLNQTVRQQAESHGIDPVTLASGTALRPLGIDPAHPEFTPIQQDADMAVEAYAAFFKSNLGTTLGHWPQAATETLGALWSQAMAYACRPGPEQAVLHSRQFCTSGLALFADWLTALRK